MVVSESLPKSLFDTLPVVSFDIKYHQLKLK